MPTEIRMPRLTDSMTEGSVVAWRKREGDPVRAGEVVAELQADKTTVDLESPEDGTLARIVAPAGSESVKVGAVLAVLERQGEAVEPAAKKGNGKLAETADPHMASDEPPPEHVAVTDRADVPSAVDLSPLARSLVAQAGLDPSKLRGAGPGGRVRMADVLATLGVDSSPTPRPHSPSQDTTGAPFEEVPHSPMRRTIARRLGESKQTIPHFYLAAHCEVDALLRLRDQLQAEAGAGLKLSLNDLLLRAAALALRNVPEANASWTDAATRRYRRVDLAVAVATDSGLLTPVVRDADRKGLAEIAAEVRDLAARARSGKLRPEEYQGGTFTVSNLGMFGVDELYAIVNPPQAGILGLGAASPRPVVRDGTVVPGTVMTCTLSADHRVIDGAAGARLLAAFKAMVERPVTMIL